MKTIRLTRREFGELGEYSCSLPTGTTVGERWKCNTNAFAVEGGCKTCKKEWRASSSVPRIKFRCPECKGELEPIDLPDEWQMGEYYDLGPPENEKEIGIHWYKIEVIPACPKHPGAEILRQGRKGPDYGKWFCPLCGDNL